MAAVGQVLVGRYRITGQLGAGGMATVYRAEDLRLLGRSVAIKEMSLAALPPDQHDWARQQFAREARLLANLNHPGLANVTDFFEEAGQSYLVMDFVPGQTLADILHQRGRLPPAQVADYARQLADVLAYLHSRQPPIIFRDLKPSNIMVTPEGRVKLIDFGIARLFEVGRSGDTQSLGTPGYAAPEQYGRTQTDARSDIYSLGMVTYQMLTGYDPARSPFSLPPPSQIIPGLSLAWDRLIARATAPNPDMRYPSVASFLADLPDPLAVSNAPTVAVPMNGPVQRTIPLYAESVAPPPPIISPPVEVTPAAEPRSRWPEFLLGLAALALLLCIALSLILLARPGLAAILGSQATATAFGVLPPLSTPTSSPTPPPPTPTATPVPPTPTGPPSGTPVPPTATPIPPTATPVPPTATPVPPTATMPPPTTTPIPSTATPAPSTPTVAPSPTGTAIVPTGGGQLRPGPTVNAPSCNSITVDGQTNDWTGIPGFALNQQMIANGWGGPSDLSGNAYLCWNPANLYMLAVITDNVHVQQHTGAQIVLGDEVEMQFDADLPGDFNTKTLDLDDYHLGMSPGDFSQLPPEVYRWSPSNRVGDISDAPIVAVPVGQGYRIEVAIPWAELGAQQPAAGKAYGLCVSVSDVDTPGATTQKNYFSNCPGLKQDDPTTWGNLILQP